MSEIEITVGIPTMNNEETIRRTLELFLTQSRPPDRIIVVDASDDRTPEIVDDVADGTDVQIDYYRQSDKGRGVGRARQDIYERFDEDVLACLDTNLEVGDDWIEKRVEFHEENPEFGVLSGVGHPGFDHEVSEHKSPHYFRQPNCSLTAAALDAVDGWDPWMPRGEDWDMHIRLWQAGVRSYVKSGLSVDRIRDEDGLDVVRKNLGRPSAILFLRKYGLWYAKFHPLHPLGEVASFTSVVALLLGGVLALTGNAVALLALAIPVGGSLVYLYHRIIRNRDGFYIQFDDVVWVATFLLLWVSALREAWRPSEYEWNYGGFR